MRIFTQVLDGMYGKPAAGVRVALSCVYVDQQIMVAEEETNLNGRIDAWAIGRFERGLYRMVFDSDGYFAGLGTAIAYPEVAVIFRVESDAHAFQVQVTLAPHSYSTYFGTIDDGPAS
jgi:5-hydroxyisourate hydrolase